MCIRSLVSFVVLLLGFLLGPGGLAQSESKKKLYLLEDTAGRRWCGFGRESTWRAEVQSLSAMLVSTVEYLNGHIAVVSVTEEDETGDWIVYDRYSLDESGALRKLHRTISVLPGDRTQKEVFLIHDGRATKQSTSSLRLSTGKPTTPSQDWLPDVPVITNIQDFPFSPLIGSKRFEVWSKGRACIEGQP